ncbi:MAG TPA: rod-binding protein [Armatimonadota bacterium]|nr:rod-binding protein [Armatimonadota bacterium]HQK92135.1 rod-binding protein [Armatimonadota bacterium]
MALELLGAGDVPASALNVADLNSLRKLGETSAGLRAAAQEFESFLLYQLVQSMRKTIHKVEMFHGGRAEEMWEGMLDQELTRELAKAGGIGLAKMIYDQMASQVESEDSAPPGALVAEQR